MKISLMQRIRFFTFCVCALFIALVFSVLVVVQSLELAFERESYAQQIDNNTNVLKQFIINDNVYSRNTIDEHWVEYQSHLAELLNQAPALTPHQQTIQNSIKSQNSNLKRLFEQITQNKLANANKVIKVHFNARLAAQLEAIRADSVELSITVKEDIHSIMRQQAAFVIFILIASVSILSISAFRLIKIFKSSLKEIKRAIEKNTGENFQKVTLSNSYQEFNDIIEKFNLMNQKLSKTTISLDEMKKVVSERTHVLEHLSKTDQLTEVANRRALFERGEMEYSRGQRNKSQLSLILMDCDFFKNINDNFGHVFGDEALKHVCKICLQEIRDIDFLARYGGEEFIVLLPDCDINGGVDIAKRIQHSLAKQSIKFENKEAFITLSMGVVSLSEKHKNFSQLINDADEAMYMAKNNGRNRIETMKDN